MQNTTELKTLLGDQAPKPFRPLAYYDRHMDCIRIELRDCSTTERRIDSTMTVLLDNFPQENQEETVGLMIKGVKHLFKQLELPLEGIIFVTQILDRLVAKYPKEVEENIRHLVYQIDLTVNLDEPQEVAA